MRALARRCTTPSRSSGRNASAIAFRASPAGLDVGPVIPAAAHALESGSADELVDVLCATVREQVARRHDHAMALEAHAGEGVADAREYVEAMLGLQVWAHGVYKQVMADPHAHGGGHEHD